MSTVERWEPAGRRLFGVRLRELRERAGWSQEELAGVAGLDRSYLAEIEKGRRNPGLSTLLKLGSALQCRVGDLVPPEIEGLPKPGPHPVKR
ncbi:MAG: helix-turn-helix domain-containing protein [Candidatus Dormibacteria bacterium]